MRRLVGLFCLAFLLAPALAAADDTQPPVSGAPQAAGQPPDRAAMGAEMQQMHAQMQQVHAQARAATLAALSSAHRSLLASVVGQLAIAANPDPAAAARTLDAALSPGEKQAILRAHASARSQMEAMMTAARAQMTGAMPPGQEHPTKWNHGSAEQAQEQDPGAILLRMANAPPHGPMPPR